MTDISNNKDDDELRKKQKLATSLLSKLTITPSDAIDIATKHIDKIIFQGMKK